MLKTVSSMGGGGATGITVNTTAITGGTSGRVLYDNSGTVGELPVTGTGSVVLNTNPSIAGGATIDATTQDINIGTSQTSGVLNLGTNTARTSNIYIGNSNSGYALSINNFNGGTQTLVSLGQASNSFVNIGSAESESDVASTVSVNGNVTIGDATKTTYILGGLSVGNTITGTTANLTSTFTLSGAALFTGPLSMNGAATNNQTFATSQTTGSLNIGGTGNATGTISIASGTGAQTIAIANATSGAKTLNIASGASSATKTLSIGASGTGTTNITIGATGGTSTTTLNGKTSGRIVPRVSTTESSATPTINTDNTDQFGLTAQAVDITSFTTNLSGTPTDGQKLWIYIVGTAARAITWGASFESSTATLPTTTVTTNRLDVGFVWNVATTKWRCVAVA